MIPASKVSPPHRAGAKAEGGLYDAPLYEHGVERSSTGMRIKETRRELHSSKAVRDPAKNPAAALSPPHRAGAEAEGRTYELKAMISSGKAQEAEGESS